MVLTFILLCRMMAVDEKMQMNNESEQNEDSDSTASKSNSEKENNESNLIVNSSVQIKLEHSATPSENEVSPSLFKIFKI